MDSKYVVGLVAFVVSFVALFAFNPDELGMTVGFSIAMAVVIVGFMFAAEREDKDRSHELDRLDLVGMARQRRHERYLEHQKMIMARKQQDYVHSKEGYFPRKPADLIEDLSDLEREYDEEYKL